MSPGDTQDLSQSVCANTSLRHGGLCSHTSSTASTVSSWSSLSVMWVEISLSTWMDCSLTSSISSLNMSTRKSKHFSAKLGDDRANWHNASTAAMRTSEDTSRGKDRVSIDSDEMLHFQASGSNCNNPIISFLIRNQLIILYQCQSKTELDLTVHTSAFKCVSHTKHLVLQSVDKGTAGT